MAIYMEPEQVEDDDAVLLQPAEPLVFRASKARTCARRIVPLHERIGTFVGIVMCGAALWFLATQSARIDVLNHTVAQISTQLQLTDTTNAVLAARAATLVTPQRVLSVAVDQHHMTFASPLHIP